LAQEWKQKTNLSNPKVARDSYLRLIDGIIYGEDPNEGFVESSVFYHPQLKFQFTIPTSWQVQNSPQQVQMAPQDGKALMIFTLAQGSNLQQAASAALQQLQLQTVGSRETTINGLPALLVEGQVQQQNGAVLRTLSAFIQYSGTIYHMLGVTTAADYPTYSQYFIGSMQTFRALTDPSKLNKKPERIHLKTTATAGTLEQALRGFGTPAARLNELAILNGMNLADQVPKGTLIKVVGE
jgi:predicted Zn-dependent protease